MHARLRLVWRRLDPHRLPPLTTFLIQVRAAAARVLGFGAPFPVDGRAVH